jgi:hypothetical protein
MAQDYFGNEWREVRIEIAWEKQRLVISSRPSLSIG